MKKLLSLILTLALLSTMFVFGATNASAAVATQTGETSYAAEGYVHINNSTTDGTQSIYYNVDDPSDHKDYDLLTLNRWAFLRFDIGKYSDIETIVLKVNARKNSYAKIYVNALSKDDYDAAIADTVNGKKTLSTANGDELLNAPANFLKYSDHVGSAESSFADTNITLTSQLKEAALEDGCIYLALYAGYPKDGAIQDKTISIQNRFCGDVEDHPALKITGTKVIEGLGTKIIASKTAVFGDSADEVDTYLHTYKPATDTTEATNSIVYNNSTYSVVRTGISTGTTKIQYITFKTGSLAGMDIDSASLVLNHEKNSLNTNQNGGHTAINLVTDMETTIGALSLNNGSNSGLGSSIALPTKVETPQWKSTLSGLGSAGAKTFDLTDIIKKAIELGEENITIRIEHYNPRTDKDNDGYRLFQAKSAKRPQLKINYLGEIDTEAEETIKAGTKFKFQAETNATGLPVMLLVAIYDSTGSIIEVEASPVLTVGTNDLVKEVDLANYTGAASVQCFFWNGTTLEPCMEVTGANVA